MRLLYARGYMKFALFGIGLGMAFILYALLELRKPIHIEGIQIFFFIGTLILLIFSFRFRKTIKYNRIEWGEGCIIIHRLSKDLKKESWGPKGKWQIRKSTVYLIELSSYGYSYELLKKNLEFFNDRAGGLGIDMEMVFIMKDGSKVPVELFYYTRKQIRMLCEYIYSETGIKPAGVLKRFLKGNKKMKNH